LRLHRKEYRHDAKGPLDGVRVLDLSRLVAGNVVSHVLADFGAEVIKVEVPGRGDDLRAWNVEGVATYWKVYARNKKSITLDYRKPRGRELLLELVGRADVLVENFVPGKLEKMHLAPEVLHKHNQRLVIVRVSGWGQTGPFAHKPGFGTLVEAMSGFAAMNGYPDRPPVLPPLATADMLSGLYGASAALIALRHVEMAGGKGQVIDLSLFEPMLSILGPEAANHRLTGRPTQRNGSRASNTAPRNIYECRDGKFVALSASMQSMAERLFTVMGREDLLTDPRRKDGPLPLSTWEAQRIEAMRLSLMDTQAARAGEHGLHAATHAGRKSRAVRPRGRDRRSGVRRGGPDVAPLHRRARGPGHAARPGNGRAADAQRRAAALRNRGRDPLAGPAARPAQQGNFRRYRRRRARAR